MRDCVGYLSSAATWACWPNWPALGLQLGLGLGFKKEGEVAQSLSYKKELWVGIVNELDASGPHLDAAHGTEWRC